MQWPRHLIDLLSVGMEVEPRQGLSRTDVYKAFLDETARRAAWRAGADPAKLALALRTPYTPIGSITAECVNGLAVRLCLHGPEWGAAVDAIHAFMEEHAEVICATFGGEEQPYDCDIGFPSIRDLPSRKDA